MNKLGGARSSQLCQEAILLRNLCIQHKVSLKAFHFPGMRNTLLNSFSKIFIDLTWVVDQDGCCPSGFPPLGVPTNRIIHNKPQQQMHEILPKGGSQPQLHHRCFSSSLIQSSSICILFWSFHSEGPKEAKTRQSITNPHCTGAAKTVLVHGSISAFHQVTDNSTAGSGIFCRKTRASLYMWTSNLSILWHG